MYLIITVDTEEDNWGDFYTDKITTLNIEIIPRLHGLFEKYGVKPTYLLSHGIAADGRAISIFRELLATGMCEVGTHPHPWSTPPYHEERSERNSMLCNLSEELISEKIKSHHETIMKNFDLEPVSFRSGRWGFDEKVARAIAKLGYKVDTSVTAYHDWTESYGPDYTAIGPSVYRFSPDDIYRADPLGELLEVPATVGYNRDNFEYSARLLKMLDRKPLKHCHINGILRKTGMLKLITLSPEESDIKDMIGLSKLMKRKGENVLNMFFHSPSLKRGLTPFNRTREDEERIFNCIEEYLSFAVGEGFEPITLSETAAIEREIIKD